MYQELKNHLTICIIADPLHLHEELCFDSAGGFWLVLTTTATQGIHLVNEDNAGLAFPCHVEQCLHQSG